MIKAFKINNPKRPQFLQKRVLKKKSKNLVLIYNRTKSVKLTQFLDLV